MDKSTGIICNDTQAQLPNWSVINGKGHVTDTALYPRISGFLNHLWAKVGVFFFLNTKPYY